VSSNAVLATLERGKPHEKAVALALFSNESSESGAPNARMAPVFARELANEFPLVREFARTAFLRALGGAGRACSLSMYADLGHLKADAEACLKTAGLPLPTWGSSSEAPSAAGKLTHEQNEPSED
jgi:hypothetical protein